MEVISLAQLFNSKEVRIPITSDNGVKDYGR